MTVLQPKTIAALLRQAGLPQDGERIIEMVAVALAESGGEIDKVVGTRRGLWLIDDSYGFDRGRMVTDGAYATACAEQVAQGGRNMQAWPSYKNDSWRNFVNAARQGIAQSASITGSVLAEDGTYVPASFYAPTVSPVQAGVGSPIAAAFEQEGPLTGLRVTGTEMSSDVASIVIGAPTYSAGWDEIPNLSFTIADPQGDLLWFQRNLWVRGARVEYLDLDLRIDEIKFEPGSHTTGQITITAIDSIIYALQLLRGARTESNVSPTNFLRRELQLAGIDANRYFLGEDTPSQTEIARDIPDQAGSTGEGEAPSAWTTAQRLAKETGKRVFVSGRKLIFGSAAFAMDWAAPGDLRIGWHSDTSTAVLASEGERWLTLPSATQTSVGNRSGITQVSGKVALNRARYFRPGVSVIVHNTPSIAAGDRRFICTGVTHTLSRDTDGAEIELIEPIELIPEPPT